MASVSQHHAQLSISMASCTTAAGMIAMLVRSNRSADLVGQGLSLVKRRDQVVDKGSR
jgi:hypothetical protein